MKSEKPLLSEAERLKAQQDPNDPAKHKPEALEGLQRFLRLNDITRDKLTQRECLMLAADLLDWYLITPKINQT